jgi:hypothetical protein
LLEADRVAVSEKVSLVGTIFAVLAITYIVASSTGLLLKTTGLKVTAIKIDPYMNIDAGTMAPTEHGK